MICEKCKIEHDGKYGTGRFCSRKCSNSRSFTPESIEKKRKAAKGKIPHNKGKIKPKINRVVGICKYCNNPIEKLNNQPKKYHLECYKKCSGGYRRGSGIGKSGWYGNIWCDSSYELAWVIYQIDHGLDFVRNTQKFQYYWDGKYRNYIPDFIQNGFLIEIKGYFNEQTYAKIQNINNLKILTKEDIKQELSYVIDKYGRDFIKLYNDNPYEQLTSICESCGKSCKKKNVYCSRACAGRGNNRNNKKRKK